MALVDVIPLYLVDALSHLDRHIPCLGGPVPDSIHKGVSVQLRRVIFKLVHHGSERLHAYSGGPVSLHYLGWQSSDRFIQVDLADAVNVLVTLLVLLPLVEAR